MFCVSHIHLNTKIFFLLSQHNGVTHLKIIYVLRIQNGLILEE